MRNVIAINFAFKLKFDGLAKMICLGRITLLDNYFDYKLALEHFIVDHRDKSNFYLNMVLLTSSLFTKSTAGLILSASPLINSWNSSWCFLFIYCPSTLP